MELVKEEWLDRYFAYSQSNVNSKDCAEVVNQIAVELEEGADLVIVITRMKWGK